MPLQSCKTCEDSALCYRCQKPARFGHVSARFFSNEQNDKYWIFLNSSSHYLSSKLKLICTAFLLIELQPQCHLNCSSTWHSLGMAQTEGERAWPQTEAALWSVPSSAAMRSAQLHFGIYLTNKKFVSVFISQDINVSFVVEEILLPGSDPNLIWHAVFVTVL